MEDKSEFAIATSQAQNPIPFFIELLFNLLSQMITLSTIKLTSQPVSPNSLPKIVLTADIELRKLYQVILMFILAVILKYVVILTQHEIS
jgi:hypothetical protein